MTTRRAILVLLSLLAVCFLFATWLEPRATAWNRRGQSDDLLTVLFGDGRRMFANHFFVKADVYFHRGYYPSIFDQARKATSEAKHLAGEPEDEDEQKHEKEMDFLGQPRDWIDRFGRNFYPSQHSHMDQPGEAREILPWLRLSADLDPQRVETYTVASYWLRSKLGKVNEAEQFLREGLRANPTSFEILFELGKLYSENKQEPTRARTFWELALRRWQEQDAADKKPDPLTCDAILANLAALEEKEGNLDAAVKYLELETKVSPFADVLNKRVAELKQKTGK